jgi:hypothetical protein
MKKDRRHTYWYDENLFYILTDEIGEIWKF